MEVRKLSAELISKFPFFSHFSFHFNQLNYYLSILNNKNNLKNNLNNSNNNNNDNNDKDIINKIKLNLFIIFNSIFLLDDKEEIFLFFNENYHLKVQKLLIETLLPLLSSFSSSPSPSSSLISFDDRLFFFY